MAAGASGWWRVWRALGERLGPLVARAYSPKNLLLTNTVVSMGLMGTGDLLQQTRRVYWDRQSARMDWSRVGRVGLTGLWMGPMNHHWYRYLDARVPGASPRAVLAKVLADLATCPIFSAAFVTGAGVLEGQSLYAALREYRSKAAAIFAVDCTVWPPTQALNFLLFPPHFRVLVISTVQLFYNSIISAIKHDDKVRGGRFAVSGRMSCSCDQDPETPHDHCSCLDDEPF